MRTRCGRTKVKKWPGFTEGNDRWPDSVTHFHSQIRFHQCVKAQNVDLSKLIPLCRYTKEFSLVNLGRIQNLIDTGRIDPARPITLKSLYDAGIQNLQDGVKILGGVNI